jgi:hypothetical protein
MVKNPLWFLLIILGFISCHEKPTFPDVPSISFNQFYFKEIAEYSLDSLIINLNFEDGNGDLGLASFETEYPYQLLDAVVDSNGDTLRFGDDNAPAEYNCVDYEIIRREIASGDSLVITSDTIYVIRNPNYFNFFLTFLVKQSDGTFREYNPAIDRNCAPPYNGRFFILNTSFDVRPLTGELKYSLISGFRLLFRNDIIKIRVQIQDRALNRSNVLETDEFNINDIILPPS